MIISAEEGQKKLDRHCYEAGTFQFGLSPKGFLLVSKGEVSEVADFKLYSGGKYFRRNGFRFSRSMDVPDNGMYLCSYYDGKFIAKRSDDTYEFASSKKALSEDFSFLLLMRFNDKIVFLLADGRFAPKALIVTLTDTPSNHMFALALLHNLVSVRDQGAADMLVREEEQDDGKKEEIVLP